MNTEDLAAGILGSTGPYEASLKRATRAIDAAIAAAVQAEREACAVLADEHDYMKCYQSNEAANIAAAIRARGQSEATK
jgi:hypothetical protein